eukprot:scaffold41841_cov67-Phaeocystis_antarctica.AAC.2
MVLRPKQLVTRLNSAAAIALRVDGSRRQGGRRCASSAIEVLCAASHRICGSLHWSCHSCRPGVSCSWAASMPSAATIASGAEPTLALRLHVKTV